MRLDFSKRALEEEKMDDLDLQGPELAQALDELTLINRYLGGYTATIGGLKQMQKRGLIKKCSTPLRVLDAGCGGGDTLRKIALWARKEQIEVQLIGLDANAYTLSYAEKYSKEYPEISYIQGNIFSDTLDTIPFDILTLSLVLHHFPTETLLTYLPIWCDLAKKGVIINDLQRSVLPYLLYQLVTRLLGASPMVREDGSLSIRKGFTQKDWEKLLYFCPSSKREFRWRWAFRHQLVIYANESHLS
ncbi:MAG: methyltransferase domain-containing protein [Bacteroidota bacterium]